MIDNQGQGEDVYTYFTKAFDQIDFDGLVTGIGFDFSEPLINVFTSQVTAINAWSTIDITRGSKN